MTDQNITDATSGTDRSSLASPNLEIMIAKLAIAIAENKLAQSSSGEAKATLRLDYQITVDVVKMMSDIRFRCLVFVTAIIAVANALLPGTGEAGTRIALGIVGFIATLGIAVYELRNSQLYEAATHRAKILENELGMIRSSEYSEEGGLFNERPPYVENEYWRNISPEERNKLQKETKVPLMSFLTVKVKHDQGLALIYSAALAGWVYLVADGLFSLPVPRGYLPSLSPELIQILSLILAIVGFLVCRKHFIAHDKTRFRPKPVKEQTKNDSVSNAQTVSAQSKEGEARVPNP